MLHLGELYHKLQEIEEPSERIKLVVKHHNGALVKFLKLVMTKPEWSDVLKGRPILFDKGGYSRTVSTFYRELDRILFFRSTVAKNIKASVLIGMYEKVQLQLPEGESQLLHDIVNGNFNWPQPNVEIELTLNEIFKRS